MNERIRDVRNDAKETQDLFASKLSISSNYVYMIEHGLREPSERTLKDICRIYNINETWLLTGEGNMHGEITREQRIANITAAIFQDDSEFRSALIDTIIGLDKDQLAVLQQIADAMLENYKKNEE